MRRRDGDDFFHSALTKARRLAKPRSPMLPRIRQHAAPMPASMIHLFQSSLHDVTARLRREAGVRHERRKRPRRCRSVEFAVEQFLEIGELQDAPFLVQRRRDATDAAPRPAPRRNAARDRRHASCR